MADEISNPVEPSQSLKRPLDGEQLEEAHPPQPILPEDSAITKAEKVERNGANGDSANNGEPAAKRVRTEEQDHKPTTTDSRDRVRGIASIKAEYLLQPAGSRSATDSRNPVANDDAAEEKPHGDDRENGGKKKKKEKGQNKDRQFGSWGDTIKLCNSRSNSPEFSPQECSFGDTCKCEHDLRKYLAEGKREDLTTFNSKCPIWEDNGTCLAGWKCRFVGSHSQEVKREDGRMELVLIDDSDRASVTVGEGGKILTGVVNVVSTKEKLDLARRRTQTEKADVYTKWLEQNSEEVNRQSNMKKEQTEEEKKENRARFVEPPFLPSEKRRIYFGPETPVLAPLTTQGNLPFRRLCVELGAQLTYSEMAMSIPLFQGQKSEWALMKAHQSEITPPRVNANTSSIVQTYDNSKDMKFGTQISANKPQQAVKAAEVLSRLVPHLRVIDLNCGCPIELVYRQGAGSALLDAPSKLEKMIRGMNAVSGEIPITAKIRMGTMTGKPNALKNIERLAFGGAESRERLGAPGCAAITLHGRSRQQRYTKNADWSYIAECAALVKSYNQKKDDLTDTIMEPDARTLPNAPDGKLYFIGNGDCYSHNDYLDHIQNAGVDSVMVARGALIKPWLFEEIEKGQTLDKSASERLQYVEKFTRYGLEAWGSDEIGVGQTRRFLLEWLSFAHRYVPAGILEHLPPSLQDRPPAYKGRNDLETLLASDNYMDWMKISEMFLGPAHKDFKFQPKHKSNSYEIEAEG
ncbi:hypothetical protein SBOR_7452 [Sclerotinia borealis F-4128]|uniref:tRNA-dihydrouridine(47) synthase [NAD(P)(+)] n=1 Tax=Sclerotinia borealis (strain F-4128) TaxID=1432307 RepID=W9C5W9_SCLBF|nr:hypothetical protein SBOR_7452 [Sclerotinia borealis F-4128]